MPSADVVVIGAGVVGASVAYHLAARGCTRVLVLDGNAAPGQGSTCRATGGFRAQFGSEANVRLSLLAREKLLRFADEIGVDPGYRPCGYLFVTAQPETIGALEAVRATQCGAGFTGAVSVDAAEIASINPAIEQDGILGGSFCSTDGFIVPLAITRGYHEAAQRLGVEFSFGAACTGLRRAGERITAVRTAEDEIPTGAVVNAAGAWAAVLAEMAGLALPIIPIRRQVALTEPCDVLPEDMPMTIFLDDGFHLRMRDGRALLLRPDTPPGDDPFDTTVDPGWLEDVAERGRRHVPCLASVPLDLKRSWGGLYEMSPDGHALLGPAPGVENFYLANGSSGHGVMHAPALGQLLAEIMLDGAASSMDARPLRPERFAEGEPNGGSTLL